VSQPPEDNVEEPVVGQEAADVPPPPAPAEPQEPTLEEQLAERTLDLQRLQAEYVNYKRRVDRDRELVRAQGEGKVLESLLTVLDDLGRAEEHGELTGGFKAVADSLRGAVAKFGLVAFGEVGEPFDPALHEAVFQSGESADVTVTSVGQVLRIGFKVGDRVLRPATVGVVEPAAPAAEPAEPAEEPENTSE
jgi:molecular chaperone GrpE